MTFKKKLLMMAFLLVTEHFDSFLTLSEIYIFVDYKKV